MHGLRHACRDLWRRQRTSRRSTALDRFPFAEATQTRQSARRCALPARRAAEKPLPDFQTLFVFEGQSQTLLGRAVQALLPYSDPPRSPATFRTSFYVPHQLLVVGLVPRTTLGACREFRRSRRIKAMMRRSIPWRWSALGVTGGQPEDQATVSRNRPFFGADAGERLHAHFVGRKIAREP